MTNLKRFILQLSSFAVTFLVATTALAAIEYTTAGVNVRHGPWGRILTGVPKGTKIAVLAKRNGFSRVKFSNGRIGWIHSKYISKNRPAKTRGTEADLCEGCLDANISATVSDAAENMKNIATFGRGAKCISNKLIAAARETVRKDWGGRTRGSGQCGIAVRKSLNRAKLWPGGGLGDARFMIPGLKNIGFKNILKPGMTPESAPSGAILVYGKPKNPRGCRGKLGNIYGHIEIKENNGSFLSDGKIPFHIQKAYGERCRPLIGVMIMGNECKTCNKSVKNACGV